MNHKLLPYQWEAINSDHKFTLLLGGVGSGKSHAGSPWVLKQYLEYPDSLDLITANTYSQLMTATLASVFKNLDAWGVPFNYNGQKKILTVNNTKKFLCLSADTYDNHRGIEVGAWWGDEAAYYKEDAFKVFSGRLRDKRGPLTVLFTTTPKGFNWLYDYFAGEKKTKDYHYIKANSYANKHLPHGYLASLAEQYDDKLIEQELGGEFVNIQSGRTYYAFNREAHVKDIKAPATPYYVGLDFNVDPFCGVICCVTANHIYVVDEIFERNTDTMQVSSVIREKTPNRPVHIVPDSTAANRKTSGESDLEILKRMGFKVMPTYNPYVIDRVNNLNRLFALNKITISSKCKKLITDLEKVSWMEGQNKLDQKTDRMLTHISDALGYVAWKLMSFKPTHKIQSQVK
jgi:PBSX family phage terminase large subunit